MRIILLGVFATVTYGCAMRSSRKLASLPPANDQQTRVTRLALVAEDLRAASVEFKNSPSYILPEYQDIARIADATAEIQPEALEAKLASGEIAEEAEREKLIIAEAQRSSPHSDLSAEEQEKRSAQTIVGSIFLSFGVIGLWSQGTKVNSGAYRLLGSRRKIGILMSAVGDLGMVALGALMLADREDRELVIPATVGMWMGAAVSIVSVLYALGFPDASYRNTEAGAELERLGRELTREGKLKLGDRSYDAERLTTADRTEIRRYVIDHVADDPWEFTKGRRSHWRTAAVWTTLITGVVGIVTWKKIKNNQSKLELTSSNDATRLLAAFYRAHLQLREL